MPQHKIFLDFKGSFEAIAFIQIYLIRCTYIQTVYNKTHKIKSFS